MGREYLTILLFSVFLFGFSQIRIGQNVALNLGAGSSLKSGGDLILANSISLVTMGDSAELVSTTGNLELQTNLNITTQGGIILRSASDMVIGQNIGNRNEFMIGDGGVIDVGKNLLISSRMVFGNNTRFLIGGTFENVNGITAGENARFDFGSNVTNQSTFEVGANSNLTFLGDTVRNSGDLTFGSSSQVSIDNQFVNENNLRLETGSNILVRGDFANSGSILIEDQSNLRIEGNLVDTAGQNQGLNVGGTLDLAGNWIGNEGDSYVIQGELRISGAKDQTIPERDYRIAKFTLEKTSGNFALVSDMTVTDSLQLNNGIVKVTENASFQVGTPLGSATIAATDQSWIAGRFTWANTPGGFTELPTGSEDFYSPITLFNVDAASSITASYINPNRATPQINADNLFAVSTNGLWEVTLNTGEINSKLRIDYQGEALGNLTLQNSFSADTVSLVISQSGDPGGVFSSLATDPEESGRSLDNLESGFITTQDLIPFQEDSTLYFAIGFAPEIINPRDIFFPEVFSPNATINAENRTYKIYAGDFTEGNIANLVQISFRIYNKFSIPVYQTQNPAEIVAIPGVVNGWNGVNFKTGAEEPQGTYFYQASGIRIIEGEEFPFEKTGALFMIR